jgi:DNA polymerase
LRTGTAGGTGAKAAQLVALYREEIGDCHRCPLGDTRMKLVFGVGNPEARVMFVGEGPGFDEDRKGEPFVGKAGQLLDKIMAAIGLDRTQVYIANAVKCHPMKDPGNPETRGNDRPPTPEEWTECLPFLKKQISIIRPEIIVVLGATALKALLGPVGGITSARGRIFPLSLDDGTEIPVLPTFHPAALLRDPELKKPVWEDMKQLRDRLGLPATPR